MQLYWKSHLEEGEMLFGYLINNYNAMIDGDTIKHFDIWYVSPSLRYYNDEIEEAYGKDLERELIPWIKSEHDIGKLFQKENWKPFRDRYEIHDMYLGYNKLFRYKQYYFQLSIKSSFWEDVQDCKYCKNNESVTHFELSLYGWIDAIFEKIQPEDKYIISEDNLMPIEDWNNNNYFK